MNLNELAEHIELMYGPPMSVISDCLRGFLIASENKALIGCDFSAIEARVVAWLAGEEKVLDIFRGDGLIYEHAAAEIYGVPVDQVTKAQRQIGKVAVLALGYQGGVGAFQQMAKGYGVKMTDAEADKIKTAWREAHPNIVKYWHSLERAAKSAISNHGKKFSAGAPGREVTYKKEGGFLFCRLPSGRALCYPYASVEDVETPWGETKQGMTYMGEDSQSKKWQKQKAYGGLLCENITQAVSRDLLAESILNLEFYRRDIVLHVHDEVVVDLPPHITPESLEKHITKMPEWAKDLPMQASAWKGSRYRK